MTQKDDDKKAIGTPIDHPPNEPPTPGEPAKRKGPPKLPETLAGTGDPAPPLPGATTVKNSKDKPTTAGEATTTPMQPKGESGSGETSGKRSTPAEMAKVEEIRLKADEQNAKEDASKRRDAVSTKKSSATTLLMPKGDATDKSTTKRSIDRRFVILLATCLGLAAGMVLQRLWTKPTQSAAPPGPAYYKVTDELLGEVSKAHDGKSFGTVKCWHTDWPDGNDKPRVDCSMHKSAAVPVVKDQAGSECRDISRCMVYFPHAK